LSWLPLAVGDRVRMCLAYPAVRTGALVAGAGLCRPL